MEVSGLTQEWCSEMPEGKSGSWLKGISELTKSGEIQAVLYQWFRAGDFFVALSAGTPTKLSKRAVHNVTHPADPA